MSHDFFINKRYEGGPLNNDEETFTVKLMAMFVMCLFVSLNACTSPERIDVTVYAASSLTDGFQRLQAEFERKHPEVRVRLIFGGSQVLRLQISNGAQADIFASANREHIQRLTERNGQEETAIATNRRHNASQKLVFSDLDQIPRLVLGSLDSLLDSIPRNSLRMPRSRMVKRSSTGFGVMSCPEKRMYVL